MVFLTINPVDKCKKTKQNKTKQNKNKKKKNTILIKNENKDEIVLFCAGIHHTNIGCPSIMTPSKMGKTKYPIFYSRILRVTVRP